MKLVKLTLFAVLCSLEVNGESPPNYYAIHGEEKRLSYVNYDLLMDQCMEPVTKTGVKPGSSGYIAFETSCNKVLDQVKYPETFEGKIPGQ
jgi:hypothetical protein